MEEQKLQENLQQYVLEEPLEEPKDDPVPEREEATVVDELRNK